MTILDLVVEPSPLLRQVCDDIQAFDDDLHVFVRDMFETMYHFKGIGLAAPQVGVLSRVIVCSYDKKELVLINPIILSGEGKVIMEEGCLSLPDILVNVERYEEITVNAKDINGNELSFTENGMMAIVIQHELDHLDGILITDKGDRIQQEDV